jgi:hypothetical protein
MINKLLCFIGMHEWEYREDEAVRFFVRDIWPYRICIICEKIEGTYMR